MVASAATIRNYVYARVRIEELVCYTRCAREITDSVFDEPWKSQRWSTRKHTNQRNIGKGFQEM